ncbi:MULTISPECIES: hypothetical protein [Hyphomicrobiales]|nr:MULTISPECIES: hypothetical protein [Hyphomicrobiales]MDI4667184.1 hypothetical protein [Xanthobacter autotrophicus]NSL62342.1 hypothetical protein [Bacillus cereus]
MDEGLRADDFRRAWPTALSAAMRDVGQLADQIETAAEKVTAANRDALVIAELLPKMVDALRVSLREDGEKLLSSSSERLEEIEKRIQGLVDEASALEKNIAARTAELELSANKLARQRELLRIETELRKRRWFHFFHKD